MRREPQTLPESMLRAVNGSDLSAKIGQTFLLVASDSHSWPRVAMLSAGEVWTDAPTELRLAVYRRSRTCAALAERRRGLLFSVIDRVVCKVHLEVVRLEAEGDAANAFFVTQVRNVEEDRVAYATVEHGIEYALIPAAQSSVLSRWAETVDSLRSL